MPLDNTQHARLRRLFVEGFTAMDLAEPLVGAIKLEVEGGTGHA